MFWLATKYTSREHFRARLHVGNRWNKQEVGKMLGSLQMAKLLCNGSFWAYLHFTSRPIACKSKFQSYFVINNKVYMLKFALSINV